MRISPFKAYKVNIFDTFGATRVWVQDVFLQGKNYPAHPVRVGEKKLATRFFMKDNQEQRAGTTNRKKPGRKPLPEKDKRVECIPEIRVTSAERAVLTEKAVEAGVSLTEYCRRRLLDTAPLYWVNPSAIIKAFGEVSKQMYPVGSNINQMTKHANTAASKNLITAEMLREFMDQVETFLSQQEVVAKAFQQFIGGKR